MVKAEETSGGSDLVDKHPFVAKPNRTLLALSIPVFFSLIAEPLTGLVDTGFIARLGSAPLAALGVGTAALSSVFWVFNFLAIGTQTSVAHSLGRQDRQAAASISSLALLMSGSAGLLLILVGWLVAPGVAALLGAQGAVQAEAVAYMRLRLFGAPAVVATLTAFGALRGMQDMRTPLWIALAVNGLNILLDALLIPGWGVSGAAVASATAQTMGAAAALLMVGRKLGWAAKLRLSEVRRLLQIGGDLFVRTGSLTLFLLLATRAATQAGVESGAAHQAIRQFWIFAALGLDALALTAQSLVGYFCGSGRTEEARRVAAFACGWGIALGVVLGIFMWFGRGWMAVLLVPPGAQDIFILPWLTAALVQPLNALAFVTDGVHWGTGDFAYLRNAVLIATSAGGLLLFMIDTSAPLALLWIWAATAVWILLRALFGVLRIWPAVGQAPLASINPATSAELRRQQLG